VVVACDVVAHWKGTPPIYRIWVQDQLFLERTFTWEHCYLEEHICVLCTPRKGGELSNYLMRHELLEHRHAQLLVTNYRVISGDARVDQQGNIWA
jgi:hypothetical protein